MIALRALTVGESLAIIGSLQTNQGAGDSSRRGVGGGCGKVIGRVSGCGHESGVLWGQWCVQRLVSRPGLAELDQNKMQPPEGIVETLARPG